MPRPKRTTRSLILLPSAIRYLSLSGLNLRLRPLVSSILVIIARDIALYRYEIVVRRRIIIVL